MSENSVVILDKGVKDAAKLFRDEIEQRYEQRKHDQERPILPPKEVFLNENDLYTRIKHFPQVHILDYSEEDPKVGTVHFSSKVPVKLPVEARAKDPLSMLKRFISEFNGRILLVAESSGRRETILDLLSKHGLHLKLFADWIEFFLDEEPLGLTVAPLDRGIILDDPAIAVISETQLFGERVQQRRLRKRKQHNADAIVRNLTELTLGAIGQREAISKLLTAGF